MINRRRLLGVVLAAVMLAGCRYTNPMLNPGPWDPYGNQGDLLVHGQDAAAAGPQIFRALSERPELKDPLARQGEPDALEIVGRSMAPKTIILKYARPETGAPRDVTLQQTRNGSFTFTVTPRPTPTPTAKPARPQRTGRTRPAPTTPEPAATPKPASKTCAATADQAIRCPIDPSRPDCRALCDAGAPCEWCK
jgi:hypothetical protein